MSKYKPHDGTDLISDASFKNNVSGGLKEQFKKELLTVFQKYGYPLIDKDHEVTFRTTSGNIAWINIKRIEIIK
ncbi:MAG: hypothetical protein HY806_02140 [Nitrospirae bacterium]|nr:hypothetical protein [Nitrospirota bacterium]